MNPEDLTLEESIRHAMKTLPAPVRRYLGEGAYTPIVSELARKYSLRVDQRVILEREVMLLLLGTETGEEFAAALQTEAAISENIISQIITDLNQEIFSSLEAEIEKEATRPSPGSRAVVALQRAPKTVQETLSDPKTEQIVAEIARTRNLHVDQTGKLIALNRDMLLGLISPQTFLQNILAMGIPEMQAKAILAEVNTKIFMPLHARMRQSASATPTPPRSSAPPTPPPRQNVPPLPPRSGGPASAPLPPKTVLPGSSTPAPMPPSVNKLEGRTLPPPVYAPPASTPRPPQPQRPPQPPQAPPPSAPGIDPYREPVE